MLKVPPGAIVLEVQAPLLATDVCATESLLVHVTVPPVATVTGFGEYAVVVSVVDPETIETGVPDVGVVVDDDDEPQAVDSTDVRSRDVRMASEARKLMTTSTTR